MFLRSSQYTVETRTPRHQMMLSKVLDRNDIFKSSNNFFVYVQMLVKGCFFK